jgi:toxin-antitoxin system PIN domain toxin
MIAVDTNILVYAHRRDSIWHVPARDAIARLAAGPARWALPWPCVHEFFAVVTHPRIYAPASTPPQAIDQLEAWLECPTLETIGEEFGYWDLLREVLRDGRVAGGRVHDARIAALCALHGIRELWTADRDFSRFPKLVTKNPLQGS